MLKVQMAGMRYHFHGRGVEMSDRTTAMPERPVLLAVAEPLGRVFDLGLGTAQDTDLSVLDTASGRSLFSVAFDRQPGPSAGYHGGGAAVDARTGRAFVASMRRTCSCVHVLDARSGAVLRTVAVGYPGRNPVAAAVDEQTGGSLSSPKPTTA
jgi:hypothetical protein